MYWGTAFLLHPQATVDDWHLRLQCLDATFGLETLLSWQPLLRPRGAGVKDNRLWGPINNA